MTARKTARKTPATLAGDALLLALADGAASAGTCAGVVTLARPDGRRVAATSHALAELTTRGLIAADAGGRLAPTAEGAARLTRLTAVDQPFLAQHRALEPATVAVDGATAEVLRDAEESPLAWLARRKDKAGNPLIAPHQFTAGERLRADFTRAQMTPRLTVNWGGTHIRPTRRAPRPGRVRRCRGRREGAADPRARRHRPRTVGNPARRVLLSEGAGGRRARAQLAGAHREGGGGAGARPPRPPLRPRRRGAWPGARAHAGVERAGRRVTAQAAVNQTVASAARASARTRSIIERRPLERCGVRCSRRPKRSNSSMASVSRMVRAAGRNRTRSASRSGP